MKTLFFIGGPIILTIGFGFYSGLLSFAEQADGIEHTAGVESGGSFVLKQEETYQCDENGNNCTLINTNTEFSEIDGLEIEETPIEYRDGAGNEYNKTKQPGIPKYTNIVMKRPEGFDWSTLKFTFDNQLENEEEVEMVEIDPPVLVIPAN